MLPELQIAAFPVFLLGLSLGLTTCAVTCLPFIGTLALGKAEGGRSGLYDTAFFLAGRLLSYTFLGALAGALGAWFIKELTAGAGNLVIALSSLLAAVWLVWPTASAQGCRSARPFRSLSPLLLGVGLTLIPCAPLATLLAAAAAGGNSAHGAWYGFVFGLGALLTPMLVLIPGIASLGRALVFERRWLRPWLRGGASLVLVLLAHQRSELFATGMGNHLVGVAVLLVLARHCQHRIRQAQRARKQVFTLHRIP